MTKDMMKITKDIVKWLNENELEEDVLIYVDGKRISFDDYGCGDKHIDNIDGVVVWVEYDVNPQDYMKFCNPSTITMSFEGPLYDVINYDPFENGLEKIFQKHGYFSELGNTWNLAIYEN